MRRLRSAAVLLIVASALVGGLPRAAHAVDPATVRLGLTRLTAALAGPTSMAMPNDGRGRLFITEQEGRVRIYTASGLAATPYVDISDHVNFGGERGLLGIAFHPRFASNGYVFISYTDSQGDLRVSQLRANPARTTVDPRTEKVFMDITHRDNANHNGGNIAFGIDGYLYVGTGDGGGGGDAAGNAQNLASPLGKILRVDVDHPASATRFYSIPPSNPFRTMSGARPEIWHYGLRNPWKFSFDRQYYNLAMADVGQNAVEEVNYTARGQGGLNFGWDCREGNVDTTALYGGAYCTGRSFVPPVATYTHDGARCSVTGGYVYRGARYASVLSGVYLYADYCTGEFWGTAKVNGAWKTALIHDYAGTPTTFGQDTSGELYVADAGGSLYRIAAARR